MAGRERPDMVISDVIMPRLSVIELCHKVCGVKRLQSIPILLVSALCQDPDTMAEGLKAGADDYLEAPYDPIKLIARVSRLIERKRADEERDKFFTGSIDMLCVADFDGCFKHINPAWPKTLGYREEELIARPFVELVHPDDYERTVAESAKGTRGGETIAFESRYRCKDGSYKWLLWNSTPDVERGLIYAVAHDITKRKIAEKELLDSNAQVTNILESITDAFYALDGQWRFTYLNASAAMLLQRAPAELIGRRIWDEFPEALRTTFYEMYHQMATRRTSVKFVEFYTPLNCWFEVHAYPAKDGISVYFRDITEQRQASNALRASEERYRLVSRATNDVIWDWDMVTGQLQRNDAVCNVFNYRAEEVGDDLDWWQEHVHPEDRERAKSGLEAVINGGGHSWSDEYRFQKGDGSYATILDRGYLARDEQGVPVRMIGAMLDITERHQTEEVLRQANERAIREYERLLDRLATLAQALGSARDLETVYQALCDFTLVSAPCIALFRWTRRSKPEYSTPSSRPKKSAKERGWGFRPSTGSSNSRAAISGSTARSGRGRPSRYICRALTL